MKHWKKLTHKQTKTKALLNYSLAKYDTQEDVSALCMHQQYHTITLDSPVTSPVTSSLCQRFFINVGQIFLNYQHREKSLTEVFWLWRDVKAVKTIPNRSSWQTESDSFNSFSPIQKHQAPNSEQLIDNMFLSFPPSWKDQTPKSDTTSWKQNFLFICILRTSNVECKRIIRYWISLYKHLETKIFNKLYKIQFNKSQWGWRRRLYFTLHTLCWLPVWAVWNSFESIRAFEWVITLWAGGG